jgi:cation/acetate symporter
MLAGVGTTFYYMCITQPWLRGIFDVKGTIAENMWWDINPISAGIFGVPVAFVVTVIVSLLTPAPDKSVQDLVDHVRYPVLDVDLATPAGPGLGAELKPKPA